MKKLLTTTAALLLLSAAPAFAMSCCGSTKGGKAGMCAKGSMAMSHGTMKGSKKGGCCCEGMGGGMSKRA